MTTAATNEPELAATSILDGFTVRTLVQAGGHIEPLKECLSSQADAKMDTVRVNVVRAMLVRRRKEAPRAIRGLKMRNGELNDYRVVQEIGKIAGMRGRFRAAATRGKLNPVRAVPQPRRPSTPF